MDDATEPWLAVRGAPDARRCADPVPPRLHGMALIEVIDLHFPNGDRLLFSAGVETTAGCSTATTEDIAAMRRHGVFPWGIMGSGIHDATRFSHGCSRAGLARSIQSAST